MYLLGLYLGIQLKFITSMQVSASFYYHERCCIVIIINIGILWVINLGLNSYKKYLNDDDDAVGGA